MSIVLTLLGGAALLGVACVAAAVWAHNQWVEYVGNGFR